MDFYIGGLTFLDLDFRMLIPSTFHRERECFKYIIVFGQRCCSTNALNCLFIRKQDFRIKFQKHNQHFCVPLCCEFGTVNCAPLLKNHFASYRAYKL